MKSFDIVRYSFPTPIFFGSGASQLLGAKLKEQQVKRPFFVTDRGLATQPIFAGVVEHTKNAGLNTGVFSEIWGNPVYDQVRAGVAAYRAFGGDAIVAIGGGAAMDVAKAIALMINHPGELFDYEDDKATRAFDKPMPYLVAIPTTSGTGSEVGRSTVISDSKTKAKKIIFDPILLPQLVLADPLLTMELPASITAATGMDALSHLLESFVAKGFHPICDGIALHGIRLVAQYLPRCVAKPDLEARGMMMNAAMMGAIAFQKGLGVTHSCAHALSTVCDLHHGLANGIMLPFAEKLNIQTVPGRFGLIAETIGLNKNQPETVIDWLRDLKAQIGIPKTLSEAGVKKENLDALVELAMQDTCHHNNPRPVTKDDFRMIFSEAM